VVLLERTSMRSRARRRFDEVWDGTLNVLEELSVVEISKRRAAGFSRRISRTKVQSSEKKELAKTRRKPGVGGEAGVLVAARKISEEVRFQGRTAGFIDGRRLEPFKPRAF